MRVAPAWACQPLTQEATTFSPFARALTRITSLSSMPTQRHSSNPTPTLFSAMKLDYARPPLSIIICFYFTFELTNILLVQGSCPRRFIRRGFRHETSYPIPNVFSNSTFLTSEINSCFRKLSKHIFHFSIPSLMIFPELRPCCKHSLTARNGI